MSRSVDNSPSLLTVRNLTVSLGNATLARVGELDLQPGRITALIGPSGSGKSTLIRAILGVLPDGVSATGSIRVKGVEQIGATPRQHRRLRGRTIGVALQDAASSLNPMRRIGAHFCDVLVAQGRPDDYPRRALEVLADCGFDQPDVLSAYPFELSGGQVQRIGLALGLVAEPELLLADEITTALDTVSQKAVLDDLRALVKRTGLGVLLVTHDLAVARQWADEIVELGKATRFQPAAPPAPVPVQANATLRMQASNLTQVYHRRVRGQTINAVNNVDLALRHGEAVAIVGQSGAGKSTLLRCLGGLMAPSGGSVLFDGVPIKEMARPALRQFRRQVQTVFQHPLSSFDPRWTVAKVVAEPLECLGIAGDRPKQVAGLLRSVGLDPAFAGRQPGDLSGGEQQRVAVARAIAPGPGVLLCDEPVSSLDADARERVISLLAHLRSSLGLTLVIVTHDLSLVERFAERVVVMSAGEIVDDRPIDQIDSATHQATCDLLAAVPREESRVSDTPRFAANTL